MGLLVDIKKDFGKFKLRVSFDAADGITGLLGASGCGKSITLKCIAGIETPDEGKIILDGHTLFDSERRINLPPQARRVGYLFQHYALFPNMTVEQNLLSGLRERNRATRALHVSNLLRSFHLEGTEDKYPRQLSGGQQQRVALGRILASAPEVLLLDEPFSALDSYLRWEMELELMDMLEHFPCTVLFVTHSRDEIRHMCQNVCVLDHGKSQPIQSVHDLFHAPTTLPACMLSGCKNLSGARPLPDGRIEATDWGVALTCHRPLPAHLSHIGVRAHYLRPCEEGAENALYCQVERVVTGVFSSIVMLRTPSGARGFSRLRMELDTATWQSLNHPQALWLQIPPDDILLLEQNG